MFSLNSILCIIGILTVCSYLFFVLKSIVNVLINMYNKPLKNIKPHIVPIVINKLVEIPAINARLFRRRTLN